MKVVYISCCRNGLVALPTVMSIAQDDVSVLTITPEVAERAAVSGYIDFLPQCRSLGISCRTMSEYSLSESDLEWLKAINPKIILVNGWNRLLPKEVIALPAAGAFGVHAGHPPRGRGRAPIAWTLINGLTDLQVYLFALTSAADDGDIVGIQGVEVTPWDDAATLYDKVALAVTQLYKKYLPSLLSGSVQLIRQDTSQSSCYPARRPKDGIIDWSRPAEQVYNFIRAQVPPYPGAFSYHRNAEVTILRAQPFDRILKLEPLSVPGRIVEVLHCGLVVDTGTTPLLVRELAVGGRLLSDAGIASSAVFRPRECMK